MTITVPDPVPLIDLALVHPGAACLLMAIMVVVGLVVPAVWSRRRTRRCAAADVLDRVLLTVERVAAAVFGARGGTSAGWG